MPKQRPVADVARTTLPIPPGGCPGVAGPIAGIMRLNGFSAAAFGKCREVPVWEPSPMGPFTQWPAGSGFGHCGGIAIQGGAG